MMKYMPKIHQNAGNRGYTSKIFRTPPIGLRAPYFGHSHLLLQNLLTSLITIYYIHFLFQVSAILYVLKLPY